MRRNALWFIPVLLLVAAIFAPAAHATIFTTTIAYTDPNTGSTHTVTLVLKLPVTSQTIPSSFRLFFRNFWSSIFVQFVEASPVPILNPRK